jgi:phosphoadenosine phosphosulfate reductase
MDRDLVAVSIARLRQFEPSAGYHLAFSGGKDSTAVLRLAQLAGVKFEAVYNVTTIDPPELIYFIRMYYRNVRWDRPAEPFLSRLPVKGFPLRQRRWCCEEYKERSGVGRVVVTGIRSAESPNRQKRRMVEFCLKRKTKTFLHPIIDWTETDVWNFIKAENLHYCTLYLEGWRRIGCLFCPFKSQSQRLMEATRYPGFRDAFIRSFEKLHANRLVSNPAAVSRWSNGKEMFYWWLLEGSHG